MKVSGLVYPAKPLKNGRQNKSKITIDVWYNVLHNEQLREVCLFNK